MNIFEDELIKERDDNNQIGIADVLNDFIISLDEYFRAPDRTKIPIGDDREINILTDNTDMIRKAFEAGRTPNKSQLNTIRNISTIRLSSLDVNQNIFEAPDVIENIRLNSSDDLVKAYTICISSISFLANSRLLDTYKSQFNKLYRLKEKYDDLELSINSIYNICKEFNYD